jgi:hypothetical protein
VITTQTLLNLRSQLAAAKAEVEQFTALNGERKAKFDRALAGYKAEYVSSTCSSLQLTASLHLTIQ